MKGSVSPEGELAEPESGASRRLEEVKLKTKQRRRRRPPPPTDRSCWKIGDLVLLPATYQDHRSLSAVATHTELRATLVVSAEGNFRLMLLFVIPASEAGRETRLSCEKFPVFWKRPPSRQSAGGLLEGALGAARVV